MESSTKERVHENLRFRSVRGLAVCSAMTSLLFLVSCPSTLAGGQNEFSIKVFTSADDQFWVNSVILEGTHEVMLIDAQLTKTNAERVLTEIKKTKKPLSLIYISHEHADHFLGLEVFKEAYPRVRIIANSAVVDRINKVYREKIEKWKTILGPGATSHVVAISKVDANFMIGERQQSFTARYNLTQDWREIPATGGSGCSIRDRHDGTALGIVALADAGGGGQSGREDLSGLAFLVRCCAGSRTQATRFVAEVCEELDPSA